VYEKLKEFLLSQKESATANHDKLSKEKSKYVKSILIEYLEGLYAVADFFSRNQNYQDNLEKNKNHFLVEDKNGFPVVKTTDSHDEDLINNFLPNNQLFNNDYPSNDSQIKHFKLFLSLTYIPPKDFFEIIDHLKSMLFYYACFADDMPLEITSHIDFSMAQLAHHIMAMLSEFSKKKSETRKKFERLLKSKQVKQQIMEDRRNLVYENYYRMDRKGKSKSQIAREIEEILIKKGIYEKPSPGENGKDHTKTIIRDLEAHPIIKKELKK
jgi:hypothetical protein